MLGGTEREACPASPRDAELSRDTVSLPTPHSSVAKAGGRVDMLDSPLPSDHLDGGRLHDPAPGRQRGEAF